MIIGNEPYSEEKSFVKEQSGYMVVFMIELEIIGSDEKLKFKPGRLASGIVNWRYLIEVVAKRDFICGFTLYSGKEKYIQLKNPSYRILKVREFKEASKDILV